MVKVRLSLDGGCLRRIEAAGHSGAGPAGADPACAAVSVLVRTAARTVALEERIVSSGTAGGRGQLEFTVGDYPEDLAPWLCGVTDFLKRGLSDIAGEFPDDVSLDIEEWRKRYGT